eukprot:14121045-Alexandrium_andersonii.AAC.1
MTPVAVSMVACGGRNVRGKPVLRHWHIARVRVARTAACRLRRVYCCSTLRVSLRVPWHRAGTGRQASTP